MLLDRRAEIHAERDCKLDEARRLRELRRHQTSRFFGFTHRDYCDSARVNKRRRCRDTTMLRDTLAGLIEPMLGMGELTPLAQLLNAHRVALGVGQNYATMGRLAEMILFARGLLNWRSTTEGWVPEIYQRSKD